MKKLVIASCFFVAACGNGPGPSVPTQPGQNLQSARHAVSACARFAPRGGDDAVTSSYFSSVIFAGIIIGPIIVASNEGAIRADGEATAVDRCLSKQGFSRRNLSNAEMQALNSRDAYQRSRLLDHLIGGGTLESYGGV